MCVSLPQPPSPLALSSLQPWHVFPQLFIASPLACHKGQPCPVWERELQWTVCAVHRPESGVPASGLPTERGKQGARGISWASQGEGQDTVLESRLAGTPAHLPSVAMQPGEGWFGCSLLRNPAPGAAVPLGCNSLWSFPGWGETCSSQRGLLSAELCSAKYSYRHEGASLTSSSSFSLRFLTHFVETFPREDREAIAIAPNRVFACGRLGMVCQTERKNRSSLKYLQLFLWQQKSARSP